VLEGSITAPRDIDPAFPPVLESIIMKSLERDRAQRYGTARALREDLLQWLKGEPEHSKRDVALYLRSIFSTEKKKGTTQAADQFSRESDELELEEGLLGVPDELVVDGEEPEKVTAMTDEKKSGEAPREGHAVANEPETQTTEAANAENEGSPNKNDNKNADRKREFHAPPPSADWEMQRPTATVRAHKPHTKPPMWIFAVIAVAALIGYFLLSR